MKEKKALREQLEKIQDQMQRMAPRHSFWPQKARKGSLAAAVGTSAARHGTGAGRGEAAAASGGLPTPQEGLVLDGLGSRLNRLRGAGILYI